MTARLNAHGPLAAVSRKEGGVMKGDRDEIERNYNRTLDHFMIAIRPTVEAAFNDMMLHGAGAIVFDENGARAVNLREESL